MYKKLITSILVVALLNLLGCYSFESVTGPEYKQVEEEEGKPDEIYVKTKDYQEYHFSDSNYYVFNDTLYGNEMLPLGAREKPLDRKIALSDISSIQFEYLNGETTVLLVVGIVAIIVGLLAALGAYIEHEIG